MAYGDFMTKKYKNYLTGVVTCTSLVLLLTYAISFASQESEVDPKLLEELAGNYEIEIQGQKGVFAFIAEEGKLIGGFPAGEPLAELEPVEVEELTFIGRSRDGTEHHFKFLRDEEGNIAKCIMSIPAVGLVVDMIKMKK